MKRHSVLSTTFASIGYDRARHILETEFRHGGVYRYFNVPLPVWKSFAKAASKGGFFARHIRDRYGFEKIE